MRIGLEREIGGKAVISVDGETPATQYATSRKLTGTTGENGAGIFDDDGTAVLRYRGLEVEVEIEKINLYDDPLEEIERKIRENVKRVKEEFLKRVKEESLKHPEPEKEAREFEIT